MGRQEDVGWVGGWGIIIRINGMEKLFSVKNITKAITKNYVEIQMYISALYTYINGVTYVLPKNGWCI